MNYKEELFDDFKKSLDKMYYGKTLDGGCLLMYFYDEPDAMEASSILNSIKFYEENK